MGDRAGFEELVDAFVGMDGVDPPGSGGGFGAGALKVGGRIFAMCPREQLIVKLPAARVTQLIADDIGSAFDAGKGRPMREWLTVQDDARETWLRLAREAYDFVRGG
ncbi:hypothetical protein acdb102_46650 [Acidothermaceae bacterium B102]|nr:hypothetical protein acdb102_46650 [Acidothermaceae bacterium B102]